MEFLDLLSVFSKSSPFAVRTLSDDSMGGELQLFKDYLYVKTQIEKDFEKILDDALDGKKRIIFLCGSSGDGKSEILTRYSKKEKYNKKVQFHLDATHSLNPRETAIERLNILFNEYDKNNLTLVVGINTGMLANYAHAGNNSKIQKSIIKYLESSNLSYNDSNYDIDFLDFKNYSSFEFSNNELISEFFSKFYKKLISVEPENILYKKYSELSDKPISAVNYSFLKEVNIEKKLIEMLFAVRLIDDQFITTRSLLDFFYCILSNEKYIFEALFDGGDNEILDKMRKFDPIKIRTKKIDNFIMAIQMGIVDEDLEKYLIDLKELGIKKDFKTDVRNLIRIFFLFQDVDFSNNYHKNFCDDFEIRILNNYKELWLAHNDLGNKSEYRKLNKFYTSKLVNAINKYNSRNISGVNSDEFLLNIYNDYKILTKLELKINRDKLAKISNKNVDLLMCPIIINDKYSIDVCIGINLFKLIEMINDGYQPNKNDKNTVVMLDHIIEEIRDYLINSDELIIVNGILRKTIKDVYGDSTEFKVV